jgi:hypothetical protein
MGRLSYVGLASGPTSMMFAVDDDGGERMTR